MAIKILHKAMLYRDQLGRMDIVSEKKILTRATICGKPFLTQLLSSWDDEENVYFVMVRVNSLVESVGHGLIMHSECIPRTCRGGCIMAPSRGAISRSMLQNWYVPPDLIMHRIQLTSPKIAALHSVHASGIIHLDIKPENILISPCGHLALGDFGLSYMSETNNPDLRSHILTETVGTPGYWAPEVETASSTAGYNYLADVWSMGMVIFELYYASTTPFYNVNTAQQIAREMVLSDVPLHIVEDDGLRGLLQKVSVLT